jgi:uncharacterized membrane protein YfcA
MTADGMFVLLALIVLFAFTVEAAAGFGSTVLTLALGVHLYPIPRLLPLIVPLNLVLELYLVTRHGGHVDRSLLWRQIVPLMGIGVAVGFALFSVASTQLLRTVFGIFVVIVAVHGLVSVLAARAPSIGALPVWASVSGLLGAGVTHGLFATGGPLLVYVLSRSPLDKGEFRSTLAAVWLIFNLVLTVVYAASRRIDGDTQGALLVLLPVVCGGIMLGEWVHARLDERRFRMAVLALLVVAGASVVW